MDRKQGCLKQDQLWHIREIKFVRKKHSSVKHLVEGQMFCKLEASTVVVFISFLRLKGTRSQQSCRPKPLHIGKKSKDILGPEALRYLWWFSC